MNWLLHNVVADMSGLYFAAFYATVVVTVIVACYLWIRSVDRTRSLEPPEVPAKLDPYEIAYLRGGENEVVRVALASLIQRGLLKITEKPKTKKWYGKIQEIHWSLLSDEERQAIDKKWYGKIQEIGRGRQPNPGELSPIESRVFEWSGFPAPPQSILKSGGITDLIKDLCVQYETALAENNLLAPEGYVVLGLRLLLIGWALILGLGGYKVWVNFVNGVNSFKTTPIIIASCGIINLAVVCREPARLSRLSRRGKAYLERLKSAYGGRKDKVNQKAERDRAFGIGDESGERGKSHPDTAYSDSLLVMGIFGVTELARPSPT